MIPFREYHLFQLLSQLNPSAPIDLTISQYFRKHKALGSKDRKFLSETLYAMIRWQGLIDYFIDNPKTWQNRYQTYLELDIDTLIKDETIPAHIRVSYPKFLFSKLVESMGEKAAFSWALSSNRRAPLTLRVNPLKVTREDFLEALKDKLEMQTCNHSPYGVEVLKHVRLFQFEEFQKGWFEVQDEASQLAANLVDAKPKQKVLDYCSGSGGKSLAIAPKMEQKGCLYIHDIRPQILTQAKKRLKRAGIFNYQLSLPKSKKLKTLKGQMDWVLVDAPCSGSGTYRRNPDLKWKFDENMLKEVTEKQSAILDEAIQYLKPQGKLVYVTCSVLADENEHQLKSFMDKHNLKFVNKPLNSAKDFDRMDGFYGAVLERA